MTYLRLSLLVSFFLCGSTVGGEVDDADLPPGAIARLGGSRLRHPGIVSVAFAPDGKALLTAGGGTVRCWELPSGKLRWKQASQTRTAVYRSDAPEIVAATMKGLALLDPGSGRVLREVVLRQDMVTADLAAIHERIVVALANSQKPLPSVGVYDWRESKQLFQVEDAKTTFSIARLSPDGKLLALGTSHRVKEPGPRDSSVLLFDAKTGKELAVLPTGSSSGVTALAFSPDGNKLASNGENKNILLWDVAARRRCDTLTREGSGFVGNVVYSPDGSRLATTDGAAIALFDTTKGVTVTRIVAPSSIAMSFSPDGKILAAACNNVVRLWEIPSGKELLPPEGHTDSVTALAVSPDGRTLVSGSDDETVRLWNLATREPIALCAGHEGEINGVAFSPDGRVVASGGEDNTVRLWEAATGKHVLTLMGYEDYINALAFSPDGKRLAIAADHDSDGHEPATVWDPATGKKVLVLATEEASFNSVAYSPDGRFLATGDAESGVQVWHAATGAELLFLEGHDTDVTCVAFSPDGAVLASADDGDEIRLWDLATGKELLKIEGEDGAEKLAFSRCGKVLISWDDGDQLNFWDTATGAKLKMWEDKAEFYSAAILPDGKTIATGMGDGTILLWNLPVGRSPGVKDLAAIWPDLCGDDAVKAWEAIQAFAASPSQAIALITEKVKPAVEDAAARKLIAQLDHDDFDTRARASTELQKLGSAAEPALQAALEGRPSQEARARIQQILLATQTPLITASADRAAFRAVQILERIASPEARALLDTFARGAPHAMLTRKAKEAGERMRRR